VTHAGVVVKAVARAALVPTPQEHQQT